MNNSTSKTADRFLSREWYSLVMERSGDQQSRFAFPKEFILFDLEYTAWEGRQERNWSGPYEQREVIQIGAIRVSGSDLSEKDSFLEYVRPVRNPELSEFIIKLTGITQLDVESRGAPFAEALEKFVRFVGDTPAYCWGKDADVLRENCKLSDVVFPLSFEKLTNLRPLMAPIFLTAEVDVDAYSSGTLIQAFTSEPHPREHDALNDMRNLLEAIRQVSLHVVPNTK